MALPAVAAAAARALPRVAKFLKRGKALLIPGLAAKEKEKPSIFSPEGIIMLFLAGMFELANIILAILDIVFGIGTLLATIVNALATILIGSWLYFRTGQLPIKRALLPFGLNSLPIVRFFPFWLWSVLNACKEKIEFPFLPDLGVLKRFFYRGSIFKIFKA